MGIKRLGRKRLAAIEKKGLLVDIGTSPVMKNAIVAASQHREGQKLTTDIVLDLAAAGAGLRSKALGVADPIGINGTSSDVSYICKVTDAVFGHVVSVQAVCLEDISDGTLTDFDLMAGDADGYLGSDAGNDGSALIANFMSVTGKDNLISVANGDFAAEAFKNKYFYITAGAATSQKATATIDCGSANIDNIVSGITRIRLQQNDALANVADVVADSSKNKASTTDFFFGISNVTTTAHLAESLAAGIGGTDGGSGDWTASNPTTTTVLVTQHASTATNNGTNYLVDDPEKPSGIIVGNFTGGIDDGVALTKGKLLLRFVGFIDFEDL